MGEVIKRNHKEQRREIKGMREKKQGWMEGQNKIKEECREKYQIKEKDNSN